MHLRTTRTDEPGSSPTRTCLTCQRTRRSASSRRWSANKEARGKAIMSGPAARKGTKERSFWKERGAQIFSGWVSFSWLLVVQGHDRKGEIKMIQDSKLVMKLSVYMCITGKEINIMKRWHGSSSCLNWGKGTLDVQCIILACLRLFTTLAMQ